MSADASASAHDDGPIVFSIEGSIAVGKSTLCELLRERGFTVFTEGADDDGRWAKALHAFYKDPPRNSYLLQTAILADFVRIRARIRMEPPGSVVFVERSPLSALTFVRNSRDSGHLTDVEHGTYMQLHRLMGWVPDHIVALVLAPHVAVKRMRRRARASESTVDEGYVRRISSLYTASIADWKKLASASTTSSVAAAAGPVSPCLLRSVTTVDASARPEDILTQVLAVVKGHVA